MSIDFSDREVTTIFWISKEGEPKEWYEIRYCSVSDWEKRAKDMSSLFAHVVLDWGDDFKIEGIDWPCTEDNKKKFYLKVGYSAKIIAAAGNPWTFSTDHAEVKSRLGKSQNTRESGKKPNRSITQQTVESV